QPSGGGGAGTGTPAGKIAAAVDTCVGSRYQKGMVTMNETYLYPYSAEEAHRRNELALWRSSHQSNIACKQAIEACIRQKFDGMHLPEDSAREVLRAFGFKRVNWVLANT